MPVSPDRPTGERLSTHSPSFTSMRLRWKNTLSTPWPWSMTSVLPVRIWGAASATRPAAGALAEERVGGHLHVGRARVPRRRPVPVDRVRVDRRLEGAAPLLLGAERAQHEEQLPALPDRARTQQQRELPVRQRDAARRVLAGNDGGRDGDALPAPPAEQLDSQRGGPAGQRGPDRHQRAQPVPCVEERAAQAVEAGHGGADPAPRLEPDDEQASGKREALVDVDRDEAGALRDRLGREGRADDQ